VFNSVPNAQVLEKYQDILKAGGLARHSKTGLVVGDVSFYHLPYARELLKQDPRVKIVILERPKQVRFLAFHNSARFCIVFPCGLTLVLSTHRSTWQVCVSGLEKMIIFHSITQSRDGLEEKLDRCYIFLTVSYSCVVKRAFHCCLRSV
jgi:hypothetical protein